MEKKIFDETTIQSVANMIFEHEQGKHKVHYIYAVRSSYDEYSIGEELPNSHRWEDNVDTGEELDGTCGTEINFGYYPEIEDVVEALRDAADFNANKMMYGGTTYVIYGTMVEYGEDEREVVLGGAEVLAVLG